MTLATSSAFPPSVPAPTLEWPPQWTPLIALRWPRLPRVGTLLVTPEGGVVFLILVTLLARLLFAGTIGLGIDESYMVAAGRTLQLGYFDHPPLAWWMAWAAAHIAGSDGALVVRLPFLLLFALTTWLMFRLTATLFGARAGLWAAALLNVSPVFGVTTGSWVLPDGPLLAALLGAAVCLVAGLASQGRAAWGWWLGAGLCAGLALFSKYTAVLVIFGAVTFLITQPLARRWLRRPHPYAAGLLALAVFLPVLLWNAEHGWASLLFQAGRAGGGKLRPFGPLITLAGEALFLLPWIWLPLMACGFKAVRSRQSDPARWLLACLALTAHLAVPFGLAAQPRPVPLGRPRIPDALSSARRRSKPKIAERTRGPLLARRHSGYPHFRRGSRRKRGSLQLAPLRGRELCSRKGPGSRRYRLVGLADRPAPSGAAGPFWPDRCGNTLERCREDRLRSRWPSHRYLPRRRSAAVRDCREARGLHGRRRRDRGTAAHARTGDGAVWADLRFH